MNSTGWVKTIDEGIQKIMESSAEEPFVLLEDSANAKYLSSSNCDLNVLNVKNMAVKSYGFILAKENFLIKEIFSQTLLEVGSNGILEHLKNKWWRKCQNSDIDGSISINNTGGMFIMLGTGVFVVVIIQLVQILSRKSKKGLFKNKTDNQPTGRISLFSKNFERNVQSITYF
jgi:hypothetical protein